MTANDLLTIRDLAQLVGWSERTVYNRRHRGDSMPPAVHVGRTVRFRRADVEAWLEEHIEAGAT